MTGSTLRIIDISAQPAIEPAGLRAGAVPELRWLPIDDLVVDDTFQRPLTASNWKAIRRIADEFSWGKFAAVVASPIVGGKYSLIDGQHRTHAAKMAGFDQVPAMIVVLPPAEQAASFAAINGNVTAMSPFHVYRAALAADEKWALQARDVVAAAGCVLKTSHPSHANKKPRELYCIQLVRKYIDKGKGDVLRAGLVALAAQPGATVDHFTNGILEPWFLAIDAGGARVLRADLVGFCAQNDLVKIRDTMVRVSKQPDYRDRTIRDLTRAAYLTLLNRFVGPEALPALAPDSERDLGGRMAIIAAQENKAQKRVGLA